MEWILPAVVGLVLPWGLAAQTAAKRPTQQVAKNQPVSVSDQEKNIRTYIELLRSDVRTQKTQMMGLVMQLDADEAAIFWPIHKDFETDYMVIGEGIVGLIKNYAETYDNMTGEVADQLATNELERKYYERFKKALDP